MAIMLGVVAAFSDVEAVLMAVATTAGVTLALTIFAFQTKYDFTGCWGETRISRIWHRVYYAFSGLFLCILVILLATAIFFSFFPPDR